MVGYCICVLKIFAQFFFIIIFYVCKPSPGRRIFLAAEHIGVFM